MGRVKVWMPEIPPLSPEAQRRAEKIIEWNLANPDLVKAHLDKYEPLQVIQKSIILIHSFFRYTYIFLFITPSVSH